MLDRRVSGLQCFSRAGGVALVTLCSSGLLAQSSAAQPGDVDCRLWDDAFISNFYVGAGLAGATVLILGCFSVVLCRLFPGAWSLLRPIFRMALVFAFVSLAATALFVWWPTRRLGMFPYAAVDPAYRDCISRPFGAAGLLGGEIGPGVAAYAQKPALIAIIFVACLLAAVIAWGAGRALAASRMKPVGTRA